MRYERLAEVPKRQVVAAGWVRRRRVFYIPGYDPCPARRYRELYRKEGAAQAALSAYVLVQGRGENRQSWQVRGCFDGATVETSFMVLDWSDLVQGSMVQGLAGPWVHLLRTVWTYLWSGALLRLMHLRKGPMIAALYPVAMLLAQLAAALVAGWAMMAGLAALFPQGIGGAAGVFAGGATVLAVLHLFRRIDRRLFVRYLLQDYAFVAQDAGAYSTAMEDRLATFRTAVAAALFEDWDEVLVVAHSSGAQIAVSVLADLVRSEPLPLRQTARPALGLLTLGQVIPMQSFLSRAHRLRADLRDLSQRHDLTWIDVTAPGDGCCFALCDPVAVTGVAPRDRRWPLVISAAFSQTLRPESWARLRWRFHRLHFQYLCAFDNLAGGIGDYDYFRITAGPMTLAARFAGRAPSQSRIDVPVSRHTRTVRGTGA